MNKALKVKLLNRLSDTIRKLEAEAEAEKLVKRKKIRAYVSSNIERKWWGRESLTLTLWR